MARRHCAQSGAAVGLGGGFGRAPVVSPAHVPGRVPSRLRHLVDRNDYTAAHPGPHGRGLFLRSVPIRLPSAADVLGLVSE